MSYPDTLARLESQVSQLEQLRVEEARERDRLRSEGNRLRKAIETVLTTFEKDEEQGYHSRDRKYAITILRQAHPRSP
jgi:hypothetical protein